MKLAFLFPGQGSQVVGMGADLYAHYPAAAKIFDQADQALTYKISTLCFYGSEDKLKETQITQPALFTTSAAALAVLREKGVLPQAVAGHSVGEYAALYAAGSLSLETALGLVSQRGDFMRRAAEEHPGAMAAIIGLSAAGVAALCSEAQDKGIVSPANMNGAGQVVISGEAPAVEVASELARSRGAKRVVPLPVSGGFHSALMGPAADLLRAVLNSAAIEDAKIPVVSNVTAGYEANAEDIRQNLALQVASPVRWEESMQRLVADGFDTFVEVGSGKVLGGLMRRIAPDAKVYSTSDTAALEEAVAAVGGAPAPKEPASIPQDARSSDPGDWVGNAGTE